MNVVKPGVKYSQVEFGKNGKARKKKEIEPELLGNLGDYFYSNQAEELEFD